MIPNIKDIKQQPQKGRPSNSIFPNTPSLERTAPHTSSTHYSRALSKLVDSGIRNFEQLKYYLENQNAHYRVSNNCLVKQNIVAEDMTVLSFIQNFSLAFKNCQYVHYQVETATFNECTARISSGPIPIPGYSLKYDVARRAFISIPSATAGSIGFAVQKTEMRDLVNRIGLVITGSVQTFPVAEISRNSTGFAARKMDDIRLKVRQLILQMGSAVTKSYNTHRKKLESVIDIISNLKKYNILAYTFVAGVSDYIDVSMNDSIVEIGETLEYFLSRIPVNSSALQASVQDAIEQLKQAQQNSGRSNQSDTDIIIATMEKVKIAVQAVSSTFFKNEAQTTYKKQKVSINFVDESTMTRLVIIMNSLQQFIEQSCHNIKKWSSETRAQIFRIFQQIRTRVISPSYVLKIVSQKIQLDRDYLPPLVDTEIQSNYMFKEGQMIKREIVKQAENRLFVQARKDFKSDKTNKAIIMARSATQGLKNIKITPDQIRQALLIKGSGDLRFYVNPTEQGKIFLANQSVPASLLQKALGYNLDVSDYAYFVACLQSEMEANEFRDQPTLQSILDSEFGAQICQRFSRKDVGSLSEYKAPDTVMVKVSQIMRKLYKIPEEITHYPSDDPKAERTIKQFRDSKAAKS